MWPRRRRVALGLLVAVLLLLTGGRGTAMFVLDSLWFRSAGYEELFWKLAGSTALVRTSFAALFAAVIYLNLRIAARSLGSIRIRRRFGNLEIAERLPDVYVTGALLLISVLSGWWLSGGLPPGIEMLASLRPVRWGIRDPLFGLDASFYVLQLPLLQLVQQRVGLLVVWIALLVAAGHAATGAIQADARRVSLSSAARRHLGCLGAAFLVVVAVDQFLDRYNLAVVGSGVGGAPGYTDQVARAPALLAVAVAALAAAVGVGLGAWRARARPAVLGLGLLALLLVASALVPAMVQRVGVEPNELARERPFLQHHLRFARYGFDLDALRRVPLAVRDSGQVSPAAARRALAKAPLWDPRPLLDAYRQTESLYRYFTFHSAVVDRYGGEPVAVAVRELNARGLPARSWQNLHLIHTRGQGAVVSPASAAGPDGSPAYLLRDVDPPRLAAGAPEALRLQRPSIYFGGGRPDPDVDYVVVDGQAEASGVGLDSWSRRLIAALAFGSGNLLLSASVDRESRLVFRRTAAERVRAIAPFLHLPADAGAQPVILGGRVVWLVDAYTASPLFPLAPSLRLGDLPVRYVRNSVKATVDAVTGEVRLYRLPVADPLLRSYERLLPGLLRPLREMPSELRAHLRYPAPLLATQAEALGAYHLPDAQAFYAKQDVWTLPTETVRNAAEAMSPTYATLPLPGGARSEFLLSIAMVAQGPQNLRALLIARNDPPHYGELLLYELPRNQLVRGPQQVEAQIDQDPEISQQLSLWKEGGSEVIRGHLLVVAVDSSLLYMEPVYLEAENNAIPQLKRVVLASDAGVVMRPTLDAAVAALLGGDAQPPPEREAATTLGAGPDRIERARQLLERADAQLRAGDWSGFGRSWQALRELLGAPQGGRAPGP